MLVSFSYDQIASPRHVQVRILGEKPTKTRLAFVDCVVGAHAGGKHRHTTRSRPPLINLISKSFVPRAVSEHNVDARKVLLARRRLPANISME